MIEKVLKQTIEAGDNFRIAQYYVDNCLHSIRSMEQIAEEHMNAKKKYTASIIKAIIALFSELNNVMTEEDEK